MTSRQRKNARAGGGSIRTTISAMILAALVVLALIGAGIVFAFSALIGVWQEQCRVEDRELDVVITSGKMVHPDVVTLHFGLTNGANLAQIPYADLRLKLLARVPNIKDIRIERRLPNRVTIDVVEREPIVRVAPPRGRVETGRVADREGVVFPFSNNTALLPVIREAGELATPPGKKLTGHAAAALRLVEATAQPELADLRVLEVDTSHTDYLLATLGNYDRVKIAWDHMLEDTRQARESLTRQLRHVLQAINVHITPQTTLWIATDWGSPGRVYASDPARNGNQ
ncbi:MAG: cell division protein FtsQ/DivIB [Kiritimatiellia bacterium]